MAHPGGGLTILMIRVTSHDKGPYQLGDHGKIGGIIGRRRPIIPPFIPPITLWVWPIYWATGRLITRRPLSPGDWVPPTYIKHIDISPPTCRPATAVAWRRVGAVVNRLVGMALKGRDLNTPDPPILIVFVLCGNTKFFGNKEFMNLQRH